MAVTAVGIYEYNPKDLIGHGAFAVVYKGRLKSVSYCSIPRYTICLLLINVFWESTFWS